MTPKPRLLVATPEVIFGLNEGSGNLHRYGINYSSGGLAPVKSTYIRGLIESGNFEVGVAIPKWESSLIKFNHLTRKEIKNIEPYLEEDHFYLIEDAAFNQVEISGSNTKIYESSAGFTPTDRAVAFSRAISNYVLSHFKPDILWVPDWMQGPAAIVAKSRGIKVVSTGHNIFTKLAREKNLLRAGIDMRNYKDLNATDWKWETNGKFDFMASTVNASDDFTTVSPSFLERILNGSFDNNPGMSPSVIQAIKLKSENLHPDGRKRVHGYLNPLESESSEMLNLFEKEGLNNLIEKYKKNQENFRKKLNEFSKSGDATGYFKEGGTLVNFPNRLFDFQKEAGFMLNEMPHLSYIHDLRFLILANGSSELEEKAKEVSKKSDGRIMYMPFSKLTEEYFKKSDNTYSLMTSSYEPCGGPNLNYPLEGSLVVGHAVDGIKDSVTELDVGKNYGTGFPYNVNDYQGLDYGLSQMKKFANLPEKERYNQYIRIAKERIQESSSKNIVKRIENEIFLPLYEEKMNQ
jgi:glycogen synthase